MFDHAFTDAIGAVRHSLETALLERAAAEERYQVDVLLGDTNWETSYSVPGEGRAPRVRADLTLDWPTWAQTAYRSWYIDGGTDEFPTIDVNVVLRIQRLTAVPDLASVLGAIPATLPTISGANLFKGPLSVESQFGADLKPIGHIVEIPYEGTFEFDEETLADGSALDTHFGAIGGWIAAALVALSDLPLQYEKRRA